MGIALLLPSGTLLAQDSPSSRNLPEGIRGGSEVVPESGVELRSYTFEPTGETLPYSVFVSSKVKPDQPAPLILALRGFTGTTLTIVRGTAVDLAEEGGYILVGVIGYNNRAGFGVQMPARGAGPAAAPGAAPRGGPPPAAAPTSGRGMPPLVGGTAATDPAQVTAYSEQDVMNVLAMVREEFNVDADRVYIMGHSQGGGGARHLVEKYPSIWAGAALLAPALFDVELTEASKILDVPVLLAVGDQDSLMASSAAFAEQLEALGATYEYKVFAGLDHSTIILGSQPEVFRFFGQHR
jgi:dienelactone hydrolase